MCWRYRWCVVLFDCLVMFDILLGGSLLVFVIWNSHWFMAPLCWPYCKKCQLHSSWFMCVMFGGTLLFLRYIRCSVHRQHLITCRTSFICFVVTLFRVWVDFKRYMFNFRVLGRWTWVTLTTIRVRSCSNINLQNNRSVSCIYCL